MRMIYLTERLARRTANAELATVSGLFNSSNREEFDGRQLKQ